MIGTDEIVNPSESCPFRQRIDAEALRELDRMSGPRAFMVPVIEFGDCWECETSNGEGFTVPGDVHPLPPSLADGVTFDREYADREEDCGNPNPLDPLAQYMPEGCSGDVASATVRRGRYLCRMSAPGYMDCTDWESHDTAQAAADSLILYHGDDCGGDDE
jgi:hypothetical protein